MYLMIAGAIAAERIAIIAITIINSTRVKPLSYFLIFISGTSNSVTSKKQQTIVCPLLKLKICNWLPWKKLSPSDIQGPIVLRHRITSALPIFRDILTFLMCIFNKNVIIICKNHTKYINYRKKTRLPIYIDNHEWNQLRMTGIEPARGYH